MLKRAKDAFFILICVAGISLISPAVARAQTYPFFYSGADIYRACLTNQDSCSFYIAGILTFRYDAGIDGIANGVNKSSEACFPGGLGLKNIVGTIDKYLRSHPDLKNNNSGFDVIQQAISNTYPC